MTGKADTAVPVYRHEVKDDTITVKKPAAIKDTVTKTVAPTVTVIDTTKQLSWVIVIKTFLAWQHKSANNEVNRLKAKNIDAAVLSKEQAIGPLLKVSTGTYHTENEAEAARSVLVAAGKIPKESTVLQLKK